MDIEKNKLKIGKVRVDIHPKTPINVDNKKPVNQTVTLRPDPDQSDESKGVAENFLKNVFKGESKYGTGLISFSLNDPDGWKKKYGDKFINAIGRSGVNISWTGDPKAIKGLKALLPKGTQANLNQGIGASGNALGGPLGAPFGGGPDQGAAMGGIPGLGQALGGLGQNPAQGGIPGISPPPDTQQVSSYIADMRNLIRLWENAEKSLEN